MIANVDANEDRISGRALSPLLDGASFRNAETRSGRAYVELSQVNPGTKMASYGFEAGDIILSANRKAIATVSELKEAIRIDEDAILLNVQRGREAAYVLVQ